MISYSSSRRCFTRNFHANILQYYLAINDDHSFDLSSSSLSLRSLSSTGFTRKNHLSENKISDRNSFDRINSLSTVSIKSHSSMINIFFHSKRTKTRPNNCLRNQNNNNSSSSFIDLPRMKNKVTISQHSNSIHSESQNKLQETIRNDKKQIRQNRISSSNCLISTVATQTDNYCSIRQQYQYNNLRRINSDLLDYIFIPLSDAEYYCF